MDSSLQNDYCKYIFLLFDVRLVLSGPGGLLPVRSSGGSEFRGLSVIGVQMSLQVKYRQTIGQIEFTLGVDLTPFTNFMFECPIYD